MGRETADLNDMESTEKKQNKSRITFVELCRIAGCLIVVGCHNLLPAVNQGVYDASRIFLSCLFADGVAVFWVIGGFFIFREKFDYRHVLRSAAVKTGLPLLFFSIFIFYCSGFILKGMTPAQSAAHTAEAYRQAAAALLSWNNPIGDEAPQLWYLYVYLMVMLFSPAINAFAKYLDGRKGAARLFLILSFAFLVLNDISDNRLFAFSHHSINAAVPAAVEMIWGKLYFKNRRKFHGKRWAAISIAGFLGLNFLRARIQYARYLISAKDNQLLYWFTSIGLLCAFCIVILCENIISGGTDSRVHRAVRRVAAYTFPIYLWHMLVIQILFTRGFLAKTERLTVGLHNNMAGELEYTLLTTAAAFVISLFISAVLRLIKNAVRAAVAGLSGAVLRKDIS